MSRKVVSLMLTIDADTDEEAWELFKEMFKNGEFDSDSIDISDDEAEDWDE